MTDTNTSASYNTVLSLYESPLKASRTGALYNAFSYPTKISPEAIAIFIATHTNPHDTILDTFGGSGTTGLAAHLCDVPTKNMIALCCQRGLQPQWGPRKAHLVEIGVLGSLVSQVLCNPPDSTEFVQACEDILEQTQQTLGWMYDAESDTSELGCIRYIIWTDFLRCSGCKSEFSYWDSSVNYEPLRLSKVISCKSCGKSIDTSKCERVTEEIYDPILQTTLLIRKRRMAKVYGQVGKRKWSRKANKKDNALVEKILCTPFSTNVPLAKLDWGDLYREGYHTGITHLHHFYTRRNFHVFSFLWSLINEYPERLQSSLRVWLLSYNSSHSTLMTRVVVKKKQADFALTGAQSGVLYISSLPVEKNILLGLRRKIDSLAKAFDMVKYSQSEVEIHNCSSENLPVGDESIDYVFTDPPFGDYIPYAELNQINELWLDSQTIRSSEIIISGAAGKSLEQYRKMLSSVFSEIHRVTKPNGKVTIIFHSAHSEVWNSLISAYEEANFNVVATSILDKMQSSFKQVVSNISVKGDPIILLEKGVAQSKFSKTSEFILESILHDFSKELSFESNHKQLYSKYILACLDQQLNVEHSAKDFYLLLQDRYAEDALIVSE